MTLPRLVLYARTSTDDNQSPEDSKRWQIAVGTSLVAGKTDINRIVHDTDVSRALPWDRRPQASRLLAEMADPTAVGTGSSKANRSERSVTPCNTRPQHGRPDSGTDPPFSLTPREPPHPVE